MIEAEQKKRGAYASDAGKGGPVTMELMCGGHQGMNAIYVEYRTFLLFSQEV